MKKIILRFSFTIVLMLNFIIAFASGNGEKTYVLTFPQYEMKDIKPLVALTNPVFESQIEIKDNNYTVFYYTTSKNVTEQDVKAALQNSMYELKSFNIQE